MLRKHPARQVLPEALALSLERAILASRRVEERCDDHQENQCFLGVHIRGEPRRDEQGERLDARRHVGRGPTDMNLQRLKQRSAGLE